MILGESLTMILWKLMLFLLPISSFPLLSKVFGGTSVAPIALLPLAVLLLFWWLPAFLKSGLKLPYQFKPLLLFFFFGLFSTLLASFHKTPSFRGIPFWRNILEAFLTLLMGVGYYLLTISIMNTQKKLHSSIKWLLLGGVVMMLYAIAQVAIWKGLGRYPDFLLRLQELISPSGRLYEQRANGFAYEPSWLAHQLNMIYLPLLLGLVSSGQSVFNRKLLKKIPYEGVILILAMAALFLSFSRIGWITVIILIAYLLFRFTNRFINRVAQKQKTAGNRTTQLLLIKFGLWIGLILLLVGTTISAGMILAKVDPRMAGLFDLDRFKNFGILGWSSVMGFAERMVFWIAAFNVFQMFPFFGSGLGLAGYFFQSTVPEFGFRLPEINKVLLVQSFIPNAKNLWIRLLSETGIVGFAMFASWVLLHWRDASELEKVGQTDFLKAMGVAGKLIVLALLVEGFSLDTFGLPYFWISLGLISGTWLVNKQEESETTDLGLPVS